MRSINRQAVILKKKQPFVDWLNFTSKTYDPPEHKSEYNLAKVNEEPNVYLIKEFDFINDSLDYIEKFKPILFEAELGGWYNSNASELWPQNRSSKVFDEWFEIELHSIVVDMEKFTLKKDKMRFDI